MINTIWLLSKIKVQCFYVALFANVCFDNTKTANKTRNSMLFVFPVNDVELSEQSLT